jgi:hypothetical protein
VDICSDPSFAPSLGDEVEEVFCCVEGMFFRCAVRMGD